MGVKKGEPALLKAVNDELVKLEKTGEAAKAARIFAEIRTEKL